MNCTSYENYALNSMLHSSYTKTLHSVTHSQSCRRCYCEI